MDRSPAGTWLFASAFQTLKGGAQTQGPDTLLRAALYKEGPQEQSIPELL